MRLHPDDVALSYLADGRWTHDTWTACLDTQSASRGSELALVDPPNREAIDGRAPRRLTWRQVWSESRRVAALLVDAGVGPGDVVGVQLANTADLPLTLLALSRIGAIPSPFPIVYRLHEVRDLASQASVSTTVTSGLSGGHDLVDLHLRLAAELDHVGTVLAWDRALDDGHELGASIPTEEMMQRLDEVEASVHAHPNDCAVICWTSGTASRAKGVPRSFGDWFCSVWATVDAPRHDETDVLLCPFPMVNAGGMIGSFGPWLVTGCRLVLHQPFDLDILISQLIDERVTYCVFAPSLITRILRDPTLAGVELPSLKGIGTGSAPIAAWAIREWQSRFGCEVINHFGSNEGFGMSADSTNIPDIDDRAIYFPRYGAVGLEHRIRTVRHIEVRLVDPDTGADVSEPGDHGELRMRGPQIFAGYLGDPGTGFDELGYVCSGDIFEIAGDEGQYLRFLDRSKDLIVRGGMKIAPADVEAIAQLCPDVAEVAAIGVPDEDLGERTCICVVPQAGKHVKLADVLEYFVAEEVARYKHPELLVEFDALPRNPLGKVLKRELRLTLAGTHGPAA